MTHRLHQQLTELADETRVRHHPWCSAHPAMDDGPCGCTGGTLAALIRALTAIHAPSESVSINSLDCAEHNPNSTTHRAWARLRPGDFESCPNCVVTPIVVCSCRACDEYPCETVDAIVASLGLAVEETR